jgi:hypothetical protein
MTAVLPEEDDGYDIEEEEQEEEEGAEDAYNFGEEEEEEEEEEAATVEEFPEEPQQRGGGGGGSSSPEDRREVRCSVNGGEPRWGGEVEVEEGADAADAEADDNDNDDAGDNDDRVEPSIPAGAAEASAEGDPDDDDRYGDRDIIASTAPTTHLEIALRRELDRIALQNDSLSSEVSKLRLFLSRRKQTYKRKRTGNDAPRKKLSGYNVFVRERFAALARENEVALRSGGKGGKGSAGGSGGGGRPGEEEDGGTDAELKKIPPASSISLTGKAWSMLSVEEKERYNAM